MKHLAITIVLGALTACQGNSNYSANSEFGDPEQICHQRAVDRVDSVNADISSSGREKLIDDFYKECLRNTALDIEKFEYFEHESNFSR